MSNEPDRINAASSTDDVALARAFATRLKESLPTAPIYVASVGVKDKAPYNLLCLREALIWRTEELARRACDALEGDDFAVAAILTRAVIENAALTWKLMELLAGRQNYSREEMHQHVIRAGHGWKTDRDELPEAFNVLTLIAKMEKTAVGVQGRYDNLSEIAHPNWSGVLALYSKLDPANFVTHFGRGLGDVEGRRLMIANAMLGSLGLFEHAYNKIADLMPAFLAELESIFPAS